MSARLSSPPCALVSPAHRRAKRSPFAALLAFFTSCASVSVSSLTVCAVRPGLTFKVGGFAINQSNAACASFTVSGVPGKWSPVTVRYFPNEYSSQPAVLPSARGSPSRLLIHVSLTHAFASSS